MRAAVIGAGAAGLAAARALHGFEVTVFDKGRGVGGRLATRRVETPLGQALFDHGAQYATARDPAFAAAICDGVEVWQARFEPAAREARLVGRAGMSSLGKALAAGLDVRLSTEVAPPRQESGLWRVISISGEDFGAFDTLIVATPAEQAVRLLEAAPILAEEAAAARTAPCWAVMAVFPQPLALPFDAIRFEAGALGWAAREGSKPGRTPVEAWTLHATPEWSRANLERPAEEVAAELAAEFTHATPGFLGAHRWRFAQVEQAAGSAFGWDPDLRLGVCGDWRLGPRVELAWQSGRELALAIIETDRRGAT